MSCQGQRLRTPKEIEYIKGLQDNETYFEDQFEHEKEAQRIHEAECEDCKRLKEIKWNTLK